MMPLDPDRNIALSYVPAARRPGVAALWHLDAALGGVVSGGRDPMIGRIKLAWWRESLAKLDSDPAPPEPVLVAASEHLLNNGITGAQLAGMEEGWAVLLEQVALSHEDLALYARARGGGLFGLTARLLGVEPETGHLRAGACWALTDLARHSGEPDRGSALAAARERLWEGSWPSPLRPLGMLAVVAARDLALKPTFPEPPGAPARLFRMLRHRMTGR